MILLNFSHPLTEEHIEQTEALTGQGVEQVINVKTQFDHQHPFVEQVRELVDSIGFSPQEWQTLSFIIQPPALNFIAVTLLAELHGRMGYFPTVLRLRPVPGSTPPQYEVAEIINLQAVRDTARERR